jgi:hypothetical protein
LYNATVEWGVYKPDLFFGVKNRKDGCLTVGLMWVFEGLDDDDQPATIYRHTYRMDKGANAYYEFNDLTRSSRQIITDKDA